MFRYESSVSGKAQGPEEYYQINVTGLLIGPFYCLGCFTKTKAPACHFDKGATTLMDEGVKFEIKKIIQQEPKLPPPPTYQINKGVAKAIVSKFLYNLLLYVSW